MNTHYSRKQFLNRLGLGGLAIGSLTLGSTACAAPNEDTDQQASIPDHELTLGMASYSLREFDLQTVIAMTQRVGIQHLCLKSMHLPLDSSPEEIRSAAALVRNSGLNLYGAGVVYMKNAEEVENAFAYAQTAEMKVIVGVPNHDLLALVEQKVKETGIKMAIHNHGPGDDLYSSPDDIWAKIKDLDPGIGFCIDIGHVVRIGEDPVEKIEKYADRLYDMHFKDVNAAAAEGSSQELGRGIIDLPAVVQSLKKIRYQGVVALEFEKDGPDPLPGIAESVGYYHGMNDGLENRKM